MIQFGVLGPLSVSRDGLAVPLGAGMPLRLVAVLLSRAGRPVAVPELIDVLWGEAPPPAARRALQAYVHRLRRALGGDVVSHRAASYLIDAGAEQVDALRFSAMAEQGRQALRRDAPDEAGRLLGGALRLWRGAAYANVDGVAAVTEEAARLDEQRLLVQEEYAAIDLDLGRHAGLVPDLVSLANAHPYRERLQGLLMCALYRSGRRADALAAFQRTRELLVTQLGVDPSADLQRLREAILRGDDAHVAGGGPGRPVVSGPAPIPAGTPVPRQLPAGAVWFTGRAPELKTLDDLLDRAADTAPAVVISAIAGTAGVGKTALAVTWSHRVADRYPGGQLYVNLRGQAADQPMKAIEALAQFLRALDVPPDRVPTDEAEAAALYRSVLAARRVLILLDNAGSVEQVRPLLPGSGGCMVVVTSRDRLGGLVAREGAHRITLDVLTPDEARMLLANAIGDRAHDERDAVADLAKMCGYLPLALRIAAANLMNDPGRTIADYVTEFERQAGCWVSSPART